jgi:peptidoglycan/xylan/chitin deacetylase (PgdA/CDA1 family)
MPWKRNYTISDEIGMPDAEVRWPEGRRCCFSIVVDLSVASGPAGVTEADLLQPASHFGMNEGLDRTLNVLQRFGRRATFVVPAAIARIYAERIRDIARLGHEIAAGGYLHEDVTNLARADERDRVSLTTDLLASLTGQRPSGWFSLPRQQDPFSVGTISPNTVDLLIEAGYGYLGNGLADDLPHYWVTDFDARRSLLTLPYYYHFDDQYFLMFPADGTGLERLHALQRNWMAEFKAQYRRGRYFGITLHPKRIGWGHRTIALEQLLGALDDYPDLWNATSAQCAAHWSLTFPSETALHLEPSIWADYDGSVS